MRVKDLIDKLQTFDPDLLLVTRGMDETDFSDLETVKLVKIEEAKTSIADYNYKKSNEKNAIPALLILS